MIIPVKKKRVQYPMLTKTLSKLGRQRNILNLLSTPLGTQLIRPQLKMKTKGWGYSSGERTCLSMHKIMGSMLSTTKTKIYIENEMLKNQIPRHKPKKRCERPLQGKLYTSEERD
jgi:hypothetical protein